MKDGRIKRKLVAIYEVFYEKKRIANLRLFYRLRIMDSERTIRYIKKHCCSVARYGDGELSFALSERKEISFQSNSEKLSEKLRTVLKSKNKKLLVCMPRYINTLSGCTDSCKRYWTEWGRHNQQHQKIVTMVRQFAGKNYLFGDALITRPYMDCQNEEKAQRIFDMLKSLWMDRNLLIVEGSKTCLGVGNDLFDDAQSIKRIIAPAVDAFSCYDGIKDEIVKQWKNELVLIALGPTATVLAADLATQGIQAIDIGHIDIEYEWYQQKATKKIAVAGKYTNEAVDGRAVSDCWDQKYLSQIVSRIYSDEDSSID